ncbi:MAG: rhodanese-like domain-containing protein, partial [Phycisphaerales bacterium]|nr:rhodanese-like domain-containing protein [Phycisphaerales bacterium]
MTTSTLTNASSATNNGASANTPLRDIEPAELKRWLDEGKVIVVDVREPDEFAAERIEGALSRPLSSLNPANVPDNRDKTVVLHCRSGKRSTEAAQRLLAAGREEVCHLKGGLK